MKLLITGGTGTLGSQLVRLARASGRWQEIHSTYRTLNPNYHRVYWHYADARNGLLDVLHTVRPTHILHTLALTSPDECEGRKLEAWEINVKATQEVAEFSEGESARLIFLSTDQIFNGEQGNYDESADVAPLNFYGDTKAEAENAIREAMPSGSFVLVRLSLMYGCNANGRKTFFDYLVSTLRGEGNLELYADQIRSMISVPNAADLILRLTDHEFQGIMHVGGPAPVSRFAFGRKLAERLAVVADRVQPVQMQLINGRARRPADVSLNTNLMERTLGTKALDIDHGLRQVLPSP